MCPMRFRGDLLISAERISVRRITRRAERQFLEAPCACFRVYRISAVSLVNESVAVTVRENVTPGFGAVFEARGG